MKKLFKIILFCILTTNSFGEGLEDGLVAYYPFNGNANDESQNTNNGTISGVSLTTDRNGNSKSAYYFDSQNDFIKINDNSSIDLRDKLTLSAWVKPDSQNHVTVIQKGQLRRNWDYGLSYGSLGEISYSKSSGSAGFTGLSFDTTKWHHIAVTVDEKANQMFFYWDGIKISGTPQATSGSFDPSDLANVIKDTSNGGPLLIGQNNTQGLEGVNFIGAIDDVRIYNRALASSEVSELHELEKPSSAEPTFQIIEGEFTWDEAIADAEAKGGRLAVLNSQEKIDQANDYLATFDREIQPWIGLTDREEEGVWKWINGESYTIDRSHWLPGEPDNSPDSDGVYITDKFKFGDHPSTLTAYLLELEKPKNESVFSLVEGNFTWDEAKADAEAKGGRLAVLNTSEVLAMANPVINSFAGSLWIGLSDSEKEGDWKWITGESLTFSNWEPGQPDSNLATEDYAHIFWSSRDSQRRWNDSLVDDPNVATGVGNINNDKGYLLEKNVSLNDGLVAYYPFNGNANDESGNGLNFETTPKLGTDRNGEPESSSVLDNGKIFSTSDLSLSGSNFSGSLWVYLEKTPSNAGERALVHGSWENSTGLFSLAFWGDGRGGISTRDSQIQREVIAPSGTFSPKQWYHLSFTSDGENLSFYIDGKLFSSLKSSLDSTKSSPLSIGGDIANVYHFDSGKIDDVRIYNRTLSSSEVSELYELEKPNPSPPVVSFDEFYEALPDETITIDATPESGFPEDFTYQWYFGTFLIPEILGGKSNSFVISANDDNNGVWTVKVSNSEGSTESSFYFAAYKDSDGDGISDGREGYVIGSDPTLADTDGDGLKDYDEVYTYGTSFSKPDTDGDGFDDIFEINTKYDPLNKESTPEAYLEIQTAVEIKFNAGKNMSYKIENSVDLENWNAIETGVAGEGNLVKRLYSIDDYKGRYFRVRREED